MVPEAKEDRRLASQVLNRWTAKQIRVTSTRDKGGLLIVAFVDSLSNRRSC